MSVLARTKSVVGLDIGAGSVKAVELARHGDGLEVTGFGQIEVPDDEPAARREAVTELFRQAGFGSKRVATSVSGKMVIVRYVNLARMNPDELASAIQFEAEKYVPFPVEEAILDFQPLDDGEESEGGEMPVLFVAAKRSQVEDHLGLLSGAGVKPEVVDVDAFALSNAWLIGQGALEDASCIAFVDVGAKKTSLNIVDGGTSRFTREIGIGGQDLTTAISRRLDISFDDAEDLKRDPGDGIDSVTQAVAPVIEELSNELQLSFDWYDNQYRKSVDRVLVSGGGSCFGNFIGELEQAVERPVVRFNPFNGVSIGDGVDAEILELAAPQLAVATGLAARLARS